MAGRMNTGPTGAQVKMPTLTKLNTATMKLSNMDHVKQLVYTSEKTVPATFITVQPKQTVSNKSIADGKVVDIDVLTKLQQQNGGNVVSFTASKEFLANLTSSKFNLNKNVMRTALKKSETNVLKLNGTESALQPGLAKVSQEKLLLPKSYTSIISDGQKKKVEVKKFAPEMKGLLSGLSTALKTTPTPTIPTQSYQLIKTSNLASSLPTAHMPQGKGSVLIAVKTNMKPLTAVSASCVKTLPAFKTSIPVKTLDSTVKSNQANMLPRSTNVVQQTKVITKNIRRKQTSDSFKKQSVIRNKPTTYLEKASSISASIDSERYHMFRKNNPMKLDPQVGKASYSQTAIYNTKQNSIEIGKRAIPSSVVSTLLNFCKSDAKSDVYHQQFTEKQKFSQQANKNTVHDAPQIEIVKREELKCYEKLNDIESEDPQVCAFSELYENAVKNVLSIKAFTDDITCEKENASSIKDFEAAFQSYLQTPLDLEKKIKRKLSSFSTSKSDEPRAKKHTLENLSPNLLHNTPHPLFSPKFTDKLTTNFFDFLSDKSKEKNPQKVKPNAFNDGDYGNFFSEFLSDHSYPNIEKRPSSYQSHADYPWLHPMYWYDKYCEQPLPLGYRGYQLPEQKATESKQTSKSYESSEHHRMKLNTVKQSSKKVEEVKAKKTSPSDEEVKKINKNKKTSEKTKTSSNRSTPSQEKEKVKSKSKEVLKFKRYTLRQRALALKKAQKIVVEKSPEQPKFVLKELTGKAVTKKEVFLGALGLRRILKRINRKEKDSKLRNLSS